MKRIIKKPGIMIPAVIIFILAAAMAILLILNSPRFRVLAALYDALDTELTDSFLTGPVTADAGFMITSLKCESLPEDSYFSGAGLKLSAMADTESRILDMKMTPTFLIYAAPSLCVRFRSDLLGISSPELYDKELVFDTAHPFNGYEDSVLHEMLGIDIPDSSEKYSADLFRYLEKISDSYSKKELRKRILESDIKKTTGYTPLYTPDKREYNCESYTITFTSGETITVCIDKSGKLRSIKSGCIIIYFCGEQNVTDDFCFVADHYPLSDPDFLLADPESDTENEFSLFDGNMTVSLTAYGTTRNYKQSRYSIDKEFTLEADTLELTLYSEKDELLYLDGTASVTILPGDTPVCEDLPDENPYSMSRAELQDAISGIYINLQNNQLMKLVITHMGETGFDDPMAPEKR